MRDAKPWMHSRNEKFQFKYRGGIEMSDPLAWTKARPTKPGFYFDYPMPVDDYERTWAGPTQEPMGEV